MMTAPETRHSLILRLRDGRNQQAWAEFLEIYQPLILRLVRCRGLQDADAREVTQDVLLAVVAAIPNWDVDPAKGSFRGWLSTITRNLVVNFLVRQSRHPRGSGDSDFARWLSEVPAADCNESKFFDIEQRRQFFQWAAARVRSEVSDNTWQAFQRTSIDRRDIAEVARDLGTTAGAIYVARSRVMKRLRECIEQLQREEP